METYKVQMGSNYAEVTWYGRDISLVETELAEALSHLTIGRLKATGSRSFPVITLSGVGADEYDILEVLDEIVEDMEN